MQSLYEELLRIEDSSLEALPLLSPTNEEKAFEAFLNQMKQDFVAAMEDDFNTAQATGKVFELVKECNRFISEGNLSENQKFLLMNAKEFLEEMDGIFSLLVKEGLDVAEEEFLKVLDLIVEIRSELRSHKLWDLSDKIRDELALIGYVIEDRSGKSIWKKVKT